MKNILITGASGGIGKAIAETLAKNGFQVYAGARKQNNIDELNRITNVVGVRLDINYQKDIKNVIKLLENNGGLFTLINNAGIVINGGLIDIARESVIKIFETNVFGMIYLTQSCFPLLINSKGRIINVSSINGFISGPFFGLYPMTKFAIETYTEALRIELKKFDVQVSVIDPGQFKTGIFQKLKENAVDYLGKTKYYKDEMSQWVRNFNPSEIGRSPDIIANQILEIIKTKEIHLRYLAVDEKEQKYVYTSIITRMLDMNRNSDNPWSLSDLKSLIDELDEKNNNK